MTYRLPDGPAPELSTTRVSSGRGARLGVVLMAGLLVVIVGFVVVNRPPPPSPAPTDGLVAVASAPVATPEVAPTPFRNELEGNDGIFGWPVVAQLGMLRTPREYGYEVSFTIVGGLLRVALLPTTVGEVHNGVAYIGKSDVTSLLALQISRSWSEAGPQIFETFDGWTIDLAPLISSRGGQVELLVANVPPASIGLNGPAPVASGYTFTVLGSRQGKQMTLNFELAWPMASQAIAYEGPRGPGLFNRCRWGDGPQGAPPRGDHEEADCLDP